MGFAVLRADMRGERRDIFTETGGWTRVGASDDEWRLNVLRAALIHAEIPFKSVKNEDATEIRVPIEYAMEAELARMRVEEALDQSQGDGENPPELSAAPPPPSPPMDAPVQTVVSDPSLGEIVYIERYGYELRVGPEPFYAVLEEEWEEFLDISAQRREFAILLEKEYERLYAHLRGAKRFPQFVRMVEAVYKGEGAADNPSDFLRAAGWTAAAAAAVALLAALLRWVGS